VRRDTRCSECQVELARGSLLRVESDRALCLACADLDDFEYLPRGGAALTRHARAHSTLQAVVPEWSRCRQRYERQGVRVGSDALRKAEEECLGDADLRSRRRMHAATRREAEDMTNLAAFAAGIGAMFPGCPANEATQIAAHACRRYSGRVGRTAAARAFEPDVVRLAVEAHVRHVHAGFDRLLSQLWDKPLARDHVRAQVEDVLRKWKDRARAPQDSPSLLRQQRG
jgi:hypothetical protein